MNPALQWDSLETGGVSLSAIANPLSETSNFTNFVGLTEFKLNDQFRVGAHVSRVDTRLGRRDAAKMYGSFRYEFEQGNYLLLGLEAGALSDQGKISEFNKVFAPTYHSYEDSVSNQMDLGLGIGYTNQNLTIALGLSKLNRPLYVLYPIQYWNTDPSDSTAIVKQDTSITLTSDDAYKVTVRQNFNVSYKWNLGSARITHFLHVSNISLTGYEFLGLQNFVAFNNGLNVGLGFYNNGDVAYTGSLGYVMDNNVGIELSCFMKEEYEYNADVEFQQPQGWPKVNAKGAYENVGYVPSFELNLFYKF